jgi:hypothetical protein
MRPIQYDVCRAAISKAQYVRFATSQREFHIGEAIPPQLAFSSNLSQLRTFLSSYGMAVAGEKRGY